MGCLHLVMVVGLVQSQIKLVTEEDTFVQKGNLANRRVNLLPMQSQRQSYAKFVPIVSLFAVLLVCGSVFRFSAADFALRGSHFSVPYQ